MSDYIDRKALIDATEKTQFTMSHFPNKDQCDGANMARLTFAKIFRIIPAADVAEVVRCKDCKYWNPYKSHHYKGHFCDVVTLFVQENEYCAWGKRKGGADDVCT